ncbi:response regulator [Sphingobium phenoxybenzoativorans]|uniref:Response regulator n=1 Tax=Sphingobium phenoxybenzoativorans TaxID=1592790 RepID=A0A975K3F7_9SPHN|nr:response regulator [Sphingobium phenoxybenzoativorans]QUT04178.1 response regulator [Sphingobium phenoxybenzoativorans]
MSAAKSILVVEDEAMIGMMLEDFLDALGYRLHAVAGTLQEGCDLARNAEFDAAVLDCNLRGEKSWPVAEILAGRGIPFVFATGGSADDVPTQFADRMTLAKPFTMGSVERVLEKLLETAG